jgi:hypothetical protein
MDAYLWRRYWPNIFHFVAPDLPACFRVRLDWSAPRGGGALADNSARLRGRPAGEEKGKPRPQVEMSLSYPPEPRPNERAGATP